MTDDERKAKAEALGSEATAAFERSSKAEALGAEVRAALKRASEASDRADEAAKLHHRAIEVDREAKFKLWRHEEDLAGRFFVSGERILNHQRAKANLDETLAARRAADQRATDARRKAGEARKDADLALDALIAFAAQGGAG